MRTSLSALKPRAWLTRGLNLKMRTWFRFIMERPTICCGICSIVLYKDEAKWRDWPHDVPLPLFETHANHVVYRNGRLSVCNICKSLSVAAAVAKANELDLRPQPSEVRVLTHAERRQISVLKLYCALSRRGPKESAYQRFRGNSSLSSNFRAWSYYAGTAGQFIEPATRGSDEISFARLRRAIIWLKRNNKLLRHVQKSWIIKNNDNFIYISCFHIRHIPAPGATLDWYFQRAQKYNNVALVDGQVRGTNPFSGEQVESAGWRVDMNHEGLDPRETGDEDFLFGRIPAGEEIVNGLKIVRSWAYEHVEPKVFPDLYPYGSGYIEFGRNGVAMKVRRRLQSIDPRWRMEPFYMILAHDLQEQAKVRFERTRVLRNNAATSGTTAKDILTTSTYDTNKTILDQLKTTAVPKYIRGHSRYWSLIRGDALTMVAAKGPPSLFMTFACHEADWEDVSNCISASGLFVDSPFEVNRHLHRKFNAFFRRFINSETGVFAPHKVTEYMIRVEFQKRGSVHYHLLVWLDVPSIETLFQFVHTSIPEDQELRELVLKYNRHTCCSTYCDGIRNTCRFGFPQPCQEKTTLSDDNRRIVYAHKPEDVWINNYNATLMWAWRGNMDIKVCIILPIML